MSIEKQKAGSSGPTKRNYSKLNTHEHQVSLIKLNKSGSRVWGWLKRIWTHWKTNKSSKARSKKKKMGEKAAFC